VLASGPEIARIAAHYRLILALRYQIFAKVIMLGKRNIVLHLVRPTAKLSLRRTHLKGAWRDQDDGHLQSVAEVDIFFNLAAKVFRP
jgi:hypothetical protein